MHQSFQTMDTIDPQTINYLLDLVNESRNNRLFPGCVIGFSHHGKHHLISSHGRAPLYGTSETTQFNDQQLLFDIASITKSMVAVAALRYVEQGRITLDEPIKSAGFLQGTGKGWEHITLKHLLTQSLKLNITQPLYQLSPTEIRKEIMGADVLRLGDGYYYHNTTSIVLGWFLEEIVQKNLDTIIWEEVFIPSGMDHTYFWKHLRQTKVHLTHNPKVAPYQGPILALPHDELAHAFALYDKAVGCSGIFSTTKDVLEFGEYVMHDAFQNNEKMLTLMLTNWLEPYGRTFGLGFDKPSKDYVCPCFASETLVMTGFTGCVLFIRPSQEKVLSIMSSTTLPGYAEHRTGPQGSISPLFEFRRAVARKFFPCKHCGVGH
jgi:CubicO group peptidase (beta-lactamase class C family)